MIFMPFLVSNALQICCVSFQEGQPGLLLPSSNNQGGKRETLAAPLPPLPNRAESESFQLTWFFFPYSV
jgi:hypothetical protein